MTHHGTLSTWVGTVGFGLILMWGCSSGSPTDPGGEDIILPRGGKGIGSELLSPRDRCSDYPDGGIVTFEDASLEEIVRDALRLSPQADLTCELVAGIVEINSTFTCSCDTSTGKVRSLVGIQNLTNLVFLNLNWHGIPDIGPLSGLTSLTDLRLTFNRISDLTALSGLTELENLDLGGNEITDITALSGLTSLKGLGLAGTFFHTITDISALSGLTSLADLSLDGNTISNLSALGGLTGLEKLELRRNEISDISALSGLPSLTDLALSDNTISDISALSGLTSLTSIDLFTNWDLANIQPLLDNTGFGVGDRVSLWNTAVSCADVERLRQKGVDADSPDGCS